MSEKSSVDNPKLSDIERELAEARARLAGTVDELSYRAQPKVIASRQAQAVKFKIDEATRTPEGGLRVERIAAAAAAVVVTLVVLRLVRRRGR